MDSEDKKQTDEAQKRVESDEPDAEFPEQKKDKSRSS
jgi:hypothetical protein